MRMLYSVHGCKESILRWPRLWRKVANLDEAEDFEVLDAAEGAPEDVELDIPKPVSASACMCECVHVRVKARRATET